MLSIWAESGWLLSLTALGITTAALWATVLRRGLHRDMSAAVAGAMLAWSLIPGLMALALFTTPLMGGGNAWSFVLAAAATALSFAVSLDVAAAMLLLGQRRDAPIAALIGPVLFLLGVLVVATSGQAARSAIVAEQQAAASAEVAALSAGIGLEVLAVDATVIGDDVHRLDLTVRLRSSETYVFPPSKLGTGPRVSVFQMLAGQAGVPYETTDALPGTLPAGYDEILHLSFTAPPDPSEFGHPSQDWRVLLWGPTTAGEVSVEAQFAVIDQ